MILTSSRAFAEWGEVFGDPVVATALLDRLLHHAVVLQIEGSSYRLRQHAELMPEHLRSKARRAIAQRSAPMKYLTHTATSRERCTISFESKQLAIKPPVGMY